MTKGHTTRRMDTTTASLFLARASITVVSIPVADQERALRFYADTLGFEVVADAPFAGLRWLQLSPPAGGPSISLVTWFERMPPGSAQGLVLETDDVHRDHAELLARGVEASEPVEAFYGTYAELRDPDGNSWLLLQAPEEA